MVISDVLRWYYPTSFGMYELEFHFSFLVGPDTTQMVSLTYVRHVSSLDDFFFNQRLDKSSPFFYGSEYPIP